MPNDHLPTKPCEVCGREIVWRKKWERSWDEVRYCSEKCRRAKRTSIDEQLEQAIMSLLSRGSASICPSEAARVVAPSVDESAWRALMEPARAAGRRLVSQGKVEFTQNGKVVDPSRAKGPVRIRRVK